MGMSASIQSGGRAMLTFAVFICFHVVRVFMVGVMDHEIEDQSDLVGFPKAFTG